MGSSSVIGGASPTMINAPYLSVASAMYADSLDETSNGIVGYLPTTFSATYPATFLFAGMTLTQANLMALGYGPLTSSEGSIAFNSMYAFDYNNNDGVAPGTMDFETVALHEIGHILGFFSVVDDLDYYMSQANYGSAAPNSIPFRASPVDLFRFAASASPSTPTAFTTTPRMLTPGTPAVFSDGVNSWAMATGKNMGDGRQASHWKDDVLTGSNVGVMDPTLGYGSVLGLKYADIRALDLIGYDVAVPEPGTFVVIGASLSAVAWRRRRQPQ